MTQMESRDAETIRRRLVPRILRQRTGEHLDRIREGRVETITQNGQAAMVVMSPERYDFLVHSAERGHLWREAIRAHRAGEPGVPAGDAILSLADGLGVEL